MNWLTKLLAPLLAFACVMAFFSAAQMQHPAKKLTSEQAEKTLNAEPKAATTIDSSAPPSGLLSDWRPDVDQAIDQLEAWLSEEHPQQELNYSMANLAALYDVKLYLSFIDYLAGLEPAQSRQALLEQQAWLQLRTERTAAARLTNGEGSLASYNASETYVYLTHERIDSLTAVMQKAKL